MLELTATQLTTLLGQVWWPFMRIGAFLTMMPVFGGMRIPVQVRIGLTLLIATSAASLMPTMPEVNLLSFQGVMIAAQEILIGGVMAFFLELLFAVFITLGQILSTQMGLGMAMMNDPVNGVSVAAISKFYEIYAILMFLTLGGHLIALDIVVRSFDVWPVGEMISQAGLKTVVMQFSWMISAALLLSLPAVVAMLLVNIAFGVMNRAAPQLNVFALGFPMTMLLGLACLLLTLSGIPDSFTTFCGEILTLMAHLEE